MVFKPKTAEKTTLGKWEIDPNLPEVKYRATGRLNLSALARDIAEKLPVKTFRDRVEFDDVFGRAFSEAWPKWEDYFSPFVREPFEKDVKRAVFEYAKIELKDEKEKSKTDKKDDNRSDTKRFFKTDGA